MPENMNDPPYFNGPRDPRGDGTGAPPTAPGGHADHALGDSGRPCPEYVPTRHELEVLAVYWLKVYADIALRCTASGVSTPDATRESINAALRVHAIECLIGVPVTREPQDPDLARELALVTDSFCEPLRRRVAQDSARRAAGQESGNPPA